MKLVELLARELKVWADTTDCYVQDDDGYVWPFIGTPEYSVNSWENGDAEVDTSNDAKYLSAMTLAIDNETAIVTRADWEAEVARLAQPQESQWIRHRGGKCPVDAGVLVDIRHRVGEVFEGESAGSGRATTWTHNNHPGDIMAYRICESEPAAEEAWHSTAPLSNEERSHAFEADIEFPSGVIHFAGPLQWRDRIREIDITVEALEEERAALVQQLEDEGFRLIGEAAEVFEPVRDMNYWRNWRVGDVLERISNKHPSVYTKGENYVILGFKNELPMVRDNFGTESYCVIEEREMCQFKFHSRPSA